MSKNSQFAGIGSAVVFGFDYRSLPCINGYLKVLNLRVLAPLSWLALIIGACLAVMGISKSSEFAGVGSAVVVGFDYRGLPCSNGYL